MTKKNSYINGNKLLATAVIIFAVCLVLQNAFNLPVFRYISNKFDELDPPAQLMHSIVAPLVAVFTFAGIVSFVKWVSKGIKNKISQYKTNNNKS